MAQRIPIQLHVANALQWLGTLYRSPADALKEHVSNAIDEHVKAKLQGAAHDRCDVTFTLDRRHVTIEYPYGMSRAEFESALRRVADSAKRAGAARTVGRLGIGIFSFQQIGRRCTFYTRKTMLSDTLRVVLKEGSDEATIEAGLARDSLARPGLRVVISELKFDPTRSRGPLAPTRCAATSPKSSTPISAKDGWRSRSGPASAISPSPRRAFVCPACSLTSRSSPCRDPRRSRCGSSCTSIRPAAAASPSAITA